ncbi:glycosyltransferase [Thalassobellus citreus]|uniref:glycosyltransferase n=1 Tax=Thalassobellus citreus TaxID=3367752 RepID=UPI0037941F73
MKLAILSQAYLYDDTASINGTLVQLHNLTYGFKEAGIEVYYITSTKDKSKPTHEIIDGVHFYWIQAEIGILAWKKIMKHYQSLLFLIKPDAIYVRGRNVLQYVAGIYANKHNITYVWGTNGDDSAEFWKNTKRLKHSNKFFLKKIVLYPLKIAEDFFINMGMKMAQVVINQSIHQQQETKRILNKEGIVLPSYFFYQNKGVKKENKILWLATLSPNKQPNVFIELVNNSSLKKWQAILGGGTKDKSYEVEITSLIKDTSVDMIGAVDFKDSFKFYESSKIYINTSKPEADGVPNAYIQSWLNGTVVLSLHHDPNNWMDTHNIGFCAKGNLNALKEKLQLLINKPDVLESMNANAIKFATETFSNKAIISDYINLFKASNS